MTDEQVLAWRPHAPPSRKDFAISTMRRGVVFGMPGASREAMLGELRDGHDRVEAEFAAVDLELRRKAKAEAKT